MILCYILSKATLQPHNTIIQECNGKLSKNVKRFDEITLIILISTTKL